MFNKLRARLQLWWIAQYNDFTCMRRANGWPCEGRKCLGKKPH
jgi:hypothetical protein